MSENTSYILKKGEEDAERLKIQNDLIKQASYDHLEMSGLSEGKIVAEIGCGTGAMTSYLASKVTSTGHVYALDISQEQLDYAKKSLDDQGITNVTYVLVDIEKEIPESLVNKMDLVYVKYVLMHLKDPAAAIKNTYNLLINGGCVATQESILGSSHSEPDSPEVRKYYQYGILMGRILGTDKNIGNILDKHFQAWGFSDVKYYIVKHQVSMENANKVVLKSIQQAKIEYIKRKVCTLQEMEEIENRLIQLGKEPDRTFIIDQGYCIAYK